MQTTADTEESIAPTIGPNTTTPWTVSSTSPHGRSMRQVLLKDKAVLPPLKISKLEIILEDQFNKLQNTTIEDKHTRLRMLLSILLGGVVLAYSNPLSWSNRLEGFVMIEKFYWEVESKLGIYLRLDELLAQIETVVTLSSSGDGRYARRLARDFDGRFTSRIPWDAIWWKYLLDPLGVNRYGRTRPPLREIFLEFSTGQPASVLHLLPREIIRYILHLGAESFLPIARSSLNDRRILHLRRSHFLTNAALTHSIFRQEAQLELVSFPYCHRGSDLDDLLNFVEQKNIAGSMTQIRIDYNDEEGDDEEEAFGGSLARLSEVILGLKFIDFGGTFSAGSLSLFQKSLNLSTIKFSHLNTFKRPNIYRGLPLPPSATRELCMLPTSVTNLYMDCCSLCCLSALFPANPHILKVTILAPSDRGFMSTAFDDRKPSLFYNTIRLQMDNRPSSLGLLKMDFPNVRQIDFLPLGVGPLGGNGFETNYDSNLQFLLGNPSLKVVTMPATFYDFIQKRRERRLEERGIDVRCV